MRSWCVRASNRGIRSCWGGRIWRRRRAPRRRPEFGEVGVGVRGHGRSHGWARSAPVRVLSTLPCSGVSYGGSSTVCVIAGGKERSAPTVGVVRRHGRARRNRARGGGRSSGLVRVGARGHGRSHGWARSAPGRVLSTLPCSGVGYGGSSTVCDIAGGEELSAPTAGVVRRHGRARGERGNGQGLTVSSKRRSAC